MNILYLNHYAGSPALGMEYRPYYLAREWVRAGHRVQMIAADFSHVRARQPRAGDETLDGIAYRWLPTPRYQGNGLGRVKNIWAFLRQVWADTRAEAESAADALEAAMQAAVIDGTSIPTDSRETINEHDLDLEGVEIAFEVWDDA